MDSTITLEGKPVCYHIRPSKRARSISLRISAGTGLEVVVPPRAGLDEVRRFVAGRSRWILKTLDYYRKFEAPPPGHLLIRGRYVPVQVVKGPASIALGEELVVTLPDRRRVRAVLQGWLLRQAEMVFGPMVEEIRSQLGVQVARISFRDTRSKWASCSRSGNLCFNWRLVMAPPGVVRYVVVHELCHRLEFNHTPKFWSRVESLCPDHRSHRKWLSSNGYRLTWALQHCSWATTCTTSLRWSTSRTTMLHDGQPQDPGIKGNSQIPGNARER